LSHGSSASRFGAPARLGAESGALSISILRWTPKARAQFLECSRTAAVPLVTGNLRHFPKSVADKVPVLTPAQFVASLEK
jgi:hypothetical protein